MSDEHRVAKQTIARHLDPHDSGQHWTYSQPTYSLHTRQLIDDTHRERERPQRCLYESDSRPEALYNLFQMPADSHEA